MQKHVARVWELIVWLFTEPKRTAEEEQEHARMCDEMEQDGRVW
jgi:hypothetical protein